MLTMNVRLQLVAGAALVWAGAFAILTGCATSGPPREAVTAARGSPDVITFEEAQASAQPEALSIVESLRPRWLRSRTAGTLASRDPVFPEAFVDGTWLGPYEDLRRIQVQSIDRIEFIDASDAATRYGINFVGGVIHVYTRRQ